MYIIRAESKQYGVLEFDKCIRILLAPDLFCSPDNCRHRRLLKIPIIIPIYSYV